MSWTKSFPFAIVLSTSKIFFAISLFAYPVFSQNLTTRDPNIGPHCFQGMYRPNKTWNSTGVPCLKGKKGKCTWALSNVREGPYENQCRFSFLTNLGIIQIEEGKNRSAEKSARRAISLFNNYKATYVLTLALANQGKYEEAIRYGELLLTHDIPKSVKSQIKTVLRKQKKRKKYVQRQRRIERRRTREERREAERNARKGIESAIDQVKASEQSNGFCLWSCPPSAEIIYDLSRDILEEKYPKWSIRALAKVNGQRREFAGGDYYVAVIEYVIQTEEGINLKCHKLYSKRSDISCPFKIVSEGVYLPGSWKRETIKITFERTERGWQSR